MEGTIWDRGDSGEGGTERTVWGWRDSLGIERTAWNRGDSVGIEGKCEEGGTVWDRGDSMGMEGTVWG